MKKLLIIVGPTASGKSSFAIECAIMLDTEVISADSMQIYKGMDVGTAKVTEVEMQGVTHKMLDVVAPTAEFSVAEYKEKATVYIEDCFSRGKTPIICGGTGLYVDAIIYPMNFSDANKNPKLRAELLEELSAFGAEYMYEKLKKLDKSAAEKIHPNDTKRLIRAIEINLTTGNRVETQTVKPIYDYLMIGFSPKNREDLYNRINARVDKMFSDGLESEVNGLLNNGLTFEAQSMQAIGYKEFRAYFDGLINRDELIAQIKQHTRNYAKRQITWFKKYTDINWFKGSCDTAIELVRNTFCKEKQ